MDPKMTSRNVPEHRNCFFYQAVFFQAENWGNGFSELLDWQLFPSLSQNTSAGSNFHCWSQWEFFSIPLTIRNSNTRKKIIHQNSAGSNFPSLIFNLTTTVHRRKYKYDFCCRQEGERVLRALVLLIALKPFLQKLKWWNSAWNMLGAFTGREMRWVNLLQLGGASPRPLCLSS